MVAWVLCMVLVRRAAVTIHHYLCPQKTAAAAAGALQLTTLISRFKFLMRSQNPAGYCPVPRCPDRHARAAAGAARVLTIADVRSMQTEQLLHDYIMNML